MLFLFLQVCAAGRTFFQSGDATDENPPGSLCPPLLRLLPNALVKTSSQRLLFCQNRREPRAKEGAYFSTKQVTLNSYNTGFIPKTPWKLKGRKCFYYFPIIVLFREVNITTGGALAVMGKMSLITCFQIVVVVVVVDLVVR